MLKKKDKTIIIFASGIIVMAVLIGYFIRLQGSSTRSQPLQNSNEKAGVAETAEVKSANALAPTPEEIVGKETPAQRLKRLNLGTTPQQELEVKLPQSREEIANPPLWSRPLNALSDPKSPPDPSVEPPMKVDPRRRPAESGSASAKDSQ